MNAELIAVGTELLLGDTINTDAAAVARLLSELGINVYWQTVVGDNRARLEQAVQLARTRADLIITTGGLGPTCDDLTKEVVAGAFGIPLELNKAEEERLRGLYRERHTYMTENHLQQVMLPRGCTVLQNDWGTAPACAFEADGCLVIMLPGPPLECEPLLRYRVRPFLAARGDGIIVSHSVKIFGIGEGTMESDARALCQGGRVPRARHGQGCHGGRGRDHDRPVPRARAARARRLCLRRRHAEYRDVRG